MADETPTKKAAPAASDAEPMAGLVRELLAPPKPAAPPAETKRSGPPTVAEHLAACLKLCADARQRSDVEFFHAGAAGMQRWSPETQVETKVYQEAVRTFANVTFTSSANT